jgi:hypothetical protein
MIRRNSCVVLRAVEVTASGESKIAFYGPFLPHVGSAPQRVRDRLYEDAYARDCRAIDVYIEDVFIGDGESDFTEPRGMS